MAAGHSLSNNAKRNTWARRVPGEKINGLRALCVNVIRFPCTREPSPVPVVRPILNATLRAPVPVTLFGPRETRSRLVPITNFHYPIY